MATGATTVLDFRELPESMISIPFNIIQIDDEGVHIMVEAFLYRKKLRLILDTGASRTVLDYTLLRERFPSLHPKPMEAKTTGLGTSDYPGFSLTLPSIQLGGYRFMKPEVVVLDLSHVNATYNKLGHKAIHGVLGSDLLMKAGALIDYRNAVLYLLEDTV